MYELQQAFESVRDFMELGGPVLTAIAVLLLVLWVLALERFMFFRTGLPRLINQVTDRWESRNERRSWQAHQVRARMISEVRAQANKGLDVIKTLVALAPLLGLMGTVTGMIEVFDVMAVAGTGNARSMASGVSKATVPTMAGMVAALAGLFASTWLNRIAERQTHLLEDQLTMDH